MTYFRDGFGDFGDWADSLISSLPNAASIATQAEALANQFTGDAAAKAAFKYFYKQLRSVLAAVGVDPRVAQALSISYDAYKTVGPIEALAKSSFALDAAGVANVAALGQAIVTAIGEIAKLAGGNAAIIDGSIGWAAVGLGCIASMSMGPITGVLGCASALVLKMLASSDAGLQWYSALVSGTHWDPRQPRAWLQLTENNSVVIQADAVRLAAVLKYYYGISSTKDLWNRLPAGDIVEGTDFPGCYGSGWGICYPEMGNPPTATTLAEIAALLQRHDIDSGSSSGSISSASLPITLGIPDRTKLESQSWTREMVAGAPYKFPDLSDVSVSMIEACAAAGRAAIAGSNTARVPYHVVLDGAYGHVDEWRPYDASGAIAVDELINFFSAVTLRQLADSVQHASPATAIETQYLLASGPITMPVRLYSTLVTGRQGCWTANDTAVNTGWGKAPADCTAMNLALAVGNSDLEAIREFAGIRLQAAMSYLLMLYKWTNGVGDVIADVPLYPPGDIRYELTAPVDPRQAIYHGLTKEGVAVWALNRADGIDEEVGAGPRYNVSTWPGRLSIAMSLRENVGVWRDTPTGPHLGARRGPQQIANLIAAREAHYGPAKRAAVEAATADNAAAATASVGPSVQIALPSRLQQSVLGAQLAMKPQIQQMLAAGVIKTKSQMEQDCIAGGGYIATDGCRPSAALEQACRDNGGTPTWDPYTKFRCPGSPLTVQQLGQLSLQVGAKQVASGVAPTPGATTAPPATGGGIGSIALIAGAALLLTKLMK